MKTVIIVLIVLVLIGGAYWLGTRKSEAPVVITNNEGVTPATSLENPEEKIIKNLLLARMADASKITSPQDVLEVRRKYNVQSSVDEMQSDLPEILSSSKEEQALFVSLTKMTAFDPMTIKFISIKMNDTYPIVEFLAGNQNQQGTAFFRKENGQWKISMLAIKPPSAR